MAGCGEGGTEFFIKIQLIMLIRKYMLSYFV